MRTKGVCKPGLSGTRVSSLALRRPSCGQHEELTPPRPEPSLHLCPGKWSLKGVQPYSQEETCCFALSANPCGFSECEGRRCARSAPSTLRLLGWHPQIRARVLVGGPLLLENLSPVTNTSCLLLVLRSFKGGIKKLYTCVLTAASAEQGSGPHSCPYT